MSTIQKAFVFIVLILAVLTATVQLVLFAQRDNWKTKHGEVDKQVKALSADLKTAQGELKNAREKAALDIGDLELQLATIKTSLEDVTRDRDMVTADRTGLMALMEQADAKLGEVADNMELLADVNAALMASKEAADKDLLATKSALQAAEENFAITSRQVKDLTENQESLSEQVKERDEAIRLLSQKIDVLSQYAPSKLGPEVTLASGAEVSGKVTRLSSDRQTAFLSIGADDGVEDGMILIVYKQDGTYAGDAQVFKVRADEAAARLIKPIRATIAEGDYVANK